MPYKTCGKCGKSCGVRTLACECGWSFAAKEKPVKAKGVRKNRTSKRVGTAFGKGARPPEKHAKVFTRDVEWSELNRGDVIKVIDGGLYYKTEQGEYCNMGYRGTCVVQSVTEVGLVIKSLKEGATGFLDMSCDSGLTADGLWKEPYSIMGLRKGIDKTRLVLRD